MYFRSSDAFQIVSVSLRIAELGKPAHGNCRTRQFCTPPTHASFAVRFQAVASMSFILDIPRVGVSLQNHANLPDGIIAFAHALTSRSFAVLVYQHHAAGFFMHSHAHLPAGIVVSLRK